MYVRLRHGCQGYGVARAGFRGRRKDDAAALEVTPCQVVPDDREVQGVDVTPLSIESYGWKMRPNSIRFSEDFAAVANTPRVSQLSAVTASMREPCCMAVSFTWGH